MARTIYVTLRKRVNVSYHRVTLEPIILWGVLFVIWKENLPSHYGVIHKYVRSEGGGGSRKANMDEQRGGVGGGGLRFVKKTIPSLPHP